MIVSLLVSIIITFIFGTGIIFIRMKASKRPTNVKGILIPPIMMSTGALMFVIPYFWVTTLDIIEAVVLGLIFSVILIATTKFTAKDNFIYIKRTKAFPIILMALLLIRIFIKYWISGSVDVSELPGMFWIMAFAMIVPWRIAMYYQFKAAERRLLTTGELTK